jgi:hypothetical protein
VVAARPARDLLEVLQLEAAKRQQEDTNRLVALANARAEQLERDRQQERATMDQRLEASRQVRIAMPFSGPSAVLLRRCAAILPRASRSHCACVSLRRHPVTGHGTTAVVPHQPALRFQLLTTVTQVQFAAALAAAQQLNVRTPCPAASPLRLLALR